MPAPSLRTITLGCKVNQYETEYVRQGLVRIGYRDAAEGEPAELCIVNTCTVTAEGDAKSRQTIRQLAKRNPGTRIVVMGCYATRAPDEVAALPGVAEVVIDKRELPDLLGRFGVVDIPTGISHFRHHHRAFVKVQDGCLLRCSFCIIPHVRAALASRPMQDIVDEVGRLTAAGFAEIILTGIHLGHYGVELNAGKPKAKWTRLSHLLHRLMQLPGDFRVRLSSIEATEVTRELIDVLAAHPRRICPHLHISMQSGSDDVLRRMRRRWGRQRFIDRCRMVRAALDLPALTTDVIVGFPGETEDDFLATCQTVEEVGFCKLHIFPFSARRGTPAADMPGQIPPAVKAERVERLSALERSVRERYALQLVGRTLDVVFEAPPLHRPDVSLGTACRALTVAVPAAGNLRGKLLPVVISGSGDGELAGRPTTIEHPQTARLAEQDL
ncbi:MAG: tRNA (N(6)-L-threonylcarbamoyladenosine(37)-C(2))-methylthiotransferase MtaB [Pirellulales bacterium]